MMSCNILYVDPTETLMGQGKKQASKPYKGLMRERQAAQLIPYHNNLKWQQASVIISRQLTLKEVEN